VGVGQCAPLAMGGSTRVPLVGAGDGAGDGDGSCLSELVCEAFFVLLDEELCWGWTRSGAYARKVSSLNVSMGGDNNMFEERRSAATRFPDSCSGDKHLS
jgi:hypothetical protein